MFSHWERAYSMDRSEEVVFCNDGSAPLRVPGFANVDFHYRLPFASRFSTPFDYSFQPWITARELAVLRVINSITEDDNWAKAVLQDDVQTLLLWRAKAEESSELINENSWTWIMRELHDKAIVYLESKTLLVFDTGAIGIPREEIEAKADAPERNGTTRKLAGFAVYKSDSQISSSLCTELERGTSCFFNSEVHSGLVYQVNPSMYPLTYQQTPVLTGAGETVSLHGQLSAGIGHSTLSPARVFPRSRFRDRPRTSEYSNRFQWLPCEIEFRDEMNVAITSYINNLDPSQFPSLYRVIEKIISVSIEPWNQVVVEAGRGRTPLRILTYGVEYSPPRLFRNLPWIRDPRLLYDDETKDLALDYIASYYALPHNKEQRGLTNRQKDWLSKGEEHWRSCRGTPNHSHQLWSRWAQSRTCANKHPQMGQSLAYDAWKAGDVGACIVPPMSCEDPLASTDTRYVFEAPPPIDLRQRFRQQGLQVVLKLSSIELTPDNPRYYGSKWAIEGLADEHIVAVAMCYYSVENIDHPKIGFSHTGRWPLDDYDYDYHDMEALFEVLAIDAFMDPPYHGPRYEVNGGQWLGSLPLRRGRLLAYPNHLMTRIEPFALQDKSKPGHLRSLVLCLVDPHYRICSTRNVLPQQPDIWFPKALEAITPKHIFLPVEIQEIIREYTDGWRMSAADAKTVSEWKREPQDVQPEFACGECCCI